MKLSSSLLAAALAASSIACAESEQTSNPQPASANASVSAKASVNLGAAEKPAAEDFNYAFDTVHTQLLFFVDHLGFSKSQGEFLTFDGGFNFNPDDWSQSSVRIVVDTDSITMNDGKWDDHMKNEDFFHVEKYPKMTFVSSKVETADGKTGKLHGDLTILGVTKPVVFDITLNKVGAHPFSKRYVAGFSGTGQFKRSDFGMNYGLPLIGNDVMVRLEVEGQRKQ